MRYNIMLQELAKDYSISFFNFLASYNIGITIEEAHYLLDYIISTIYGVECQWYTDSIRSYGVIGVSVISSSVATDNSLYYEDRVALVQLACSYFVAEAKVAL